MSLLQRLSFNQMTADPWSLEQVVRNCSRSGIPYIGVWRHKLGGDAAKASAMIRSEGLRVSSLCRGGWFSAPTAEERRKRVDAKLSELGLSELRHRLAGQVNNCIVFHKALRRWFGRSDIPLGARERPHLVTVLLQDFGQPPADKTGCARDRDVHRPAPRFMAFAEIRQ